MLSLRNNVVWLLWGRFNLRVCQYTCLPSASLCCWPRICVRLFCVHMNVYNSGTAVVKPQWPAGICKVSCSGFLIRCKTLTDLLRQQKNQNQLGDIIHCLLIFICDSRWLHQVYQGSGEAVEEDASVTEKYLTGKMWWNKQGEKEAGGQRRWERKNGRWERWWILKCQFAQIICKVFVLSADISRYTTLRSLQQYKDRGG